MLFLRFMGQTKPRLKVSEGRPRTWETPHQLWCRLAWKNHPGRRRAESYSVTATPAPATMKVGQFFLLQCNLPIYYGICAMNRFLHCTSLGASDVKTTFYIRLLVKLVWCPCPILFCLGSGSASSADMVNSAQIWGPNALTSLLRSEDLLGLPPLLPAR